MAEKIQSTIVNTIPLWKNQMVIAMGVEHSNQAAKAQHEVSELTNNLLKKNAEQLHTASVETAKESERGIVDIETLKKTNAELITTLDDVLTIWSTREDTGQSIALNVDMQVFGSDMPRPMSMSGSFDMSVAENGDIVIRSDGIYLINGFHYQNGEFRM